MRLLLLVWLIMGVMLDMEFAWRLGEKLRNITSLLVDPEESFVGFIAVLEV